MATSPLSPDAPFASLNGLRVIRASLRVPGTGLWTIDVMLDAAPPVALPTGPLSASVVLGDLTLVGTILPGNSGAFVAAGWYRVVGGAGAWASTVAARAYHNDAGLSAGEILTDLAADAGEQLSLDADVVAAQLQGVDYARAAGPASRALAELLLLASPTSSWWVDYAGVTHVGARPVTAPAAGFAFDLIDYQPSARLLELGADALLALAPGSLIVDERLPAPLVVREFEVLVDDSLRVRAWVDEQPATAAPVPRPNENRIMRSLRAIVRETLPQLVYQGFSRYRVVAMTSGRADLQACDPARGLPDLQLVRMAPGLAGSSTKLTPGCVVLVAFADGDPSQPLIVSYSPTDDAGFVPGDATLSASTAVLYAPGNGTPDQFIRISRDKGLEIYTNWGRLTLGPDGLHLTSSAANARLDMFAVGGLPAFLSALGGMAVLQAPVVTVKGGAVNMGSDGGATNEAATGAVGAFITSLVEAIATITTATPGAAAMAPIQALLPELALTLAKIGKVV